MAGVTAVAQTMSGFNPAAGSRTLFALAGAIDSNASPKAATALAQPFPLRPSSLLLCSSSASTQVATAGASVGSIDNLARRPNQLRWVVTERREMFQYALVSRGVE